MSAEQIDAEKLERVLALADKAASYTQDHFTISRADRDVLLTAARRYLSTLPRVKEVEVSHWAVVDRNGHVLSTFSNKVSADEYASGAGGPRHVVRLTGTAKVRA